MAKTCEEIFYQEFIRMMNERRGMRGVVALNDIPIVPNNWVVDTHDKVMIRGINEPYFSELNDTEAILWSKPKLCRRKFNYKGEFIRPKDNPEGYVLEDVVLPHNCVALVSDVQINIPNSVEDKRGKRKLYRPSEGFEYVDVINKRAGDKRIVKYIYIVPRCYCYKENMVALTIMFNKPRSYYLAAQIALTNGQYIFLEVVPYKPTSNVAKNFRVLKTKTENLNFDDEIKALLDFWVDNGIMFRPSDCVLYESVKGKENLAYDLLPPVLDEFISYDPTHSMADDKENVEDLDLFVTE